MAALVTTVGSAALAQPWGGRPAVPPTQAPDPPYAVTQRGTFSRTWSRTRQLTDRTTGATVEKLDTYQELGDGICYENPNKPGEWLDSEDLIRVTPTGAAAVQGPTKAYFATELNAPGAITLVTSAGQSFQSHPVGLYYRDLASGKVALIAELQNTSGILVPPNMVVYTNALAGLRASFLYVWAHNGFDQSLVLEESPPGPDVVAGFNPATTRLELWTALDSWPAPQAVRPVTLKPGATAPFDLVDHLLFFADSWLPVGAAFSFGDADLPGAGEPAQVRVADPADTNKVQVAKNIVRMGQQTVLIESVNYADVLPRLKTLPQPGTRADAGKTGSQSGQERKNASASAGKPVPPAPMALARASSLPRGLALDYSSLSGSASSFTFSNGWTYVISNSFSVGPSTASFQNGAVVKYTQNAYLMVSGPVSFPSSRTGGPCLFTSKSDDGSGQIIDGSGSRPTASTGANPALSVYYDTNSVNVQNAFFRWAQTGVNFSGNSGGPNHYVQSTSFKDCNVGIYEYLPSAVLYLQNPVSYCDVATPVNRQAGLLSGSMSQACQTDLYFNAARNSPSGSETGTSANPYPGSGQRQADGTNYFDLFLNQALSNTLTNTWIPGCTALTIHLVGSNPLYGITNYVTDGIRLPACPGEYFARGLSVLGDGTNSTILQLAPNSSPPVNWADKHVFQSEYPASPQNGHFFFAPFTMSGMTIDCNWPNQSTNSTFDNPNISDDNCFCNRYKNGGIYVAAEWITIQNLTVTNFGAKGTDILLYGPYCQTNCTDLTTNIWSDPGVEAFAIWAQTANLNQGTNPITIQNCMVTGFTAVHGGYASCITVSTHVPAGLVSGDTGPWFFNDLNKTNAALVQSNYVCSGPHVIALNCGTLDGAVKSDMATFSNNYCDGVGLGFNSDTLGVHHLSITNNTFTNCYHGISFGGAFGCGSYQWTNINIVGNKFAFLGQQSFTNYWTFYHTNTQGCPNLSGCAYVNTNSLYTSNVWSECYAVRLAGACGNYVAISNNTCTTVDASSWTQPPGGPYTNEYYVVRLLSDSVPDPAVGLTCGCDNLSPTCSGNTASLAAYSYSPNDPANDWTKRYMVGGPSGLVGYWRLNESSGTSASDASGNGNTGTLTNGPTWTTGYYGGALSLDGNNDYVTIPDATNLRPANVTVAAWFNASGFGSAMTVVTKPWNGPPWSSPYVSWLIRINNQGTLEFDVGNAGGYSAWTIAVPWPYLQVGQWYHVALTYDGTTLTAYLNGVSLGTNGTVNGSVGYGSTPVLLGADYGASPACDYLNGKVDDVRVYNRALSAAEITAVMNGAGSGGN